jgi:hypothetical protein
MHRDTTYLMPLRNFETNFSVKFYMISCFRICHLRQGDVVAQYHLLIVAPSRRIAAVALSLRCTQVLSL